MLPTDLFDDGMMVSLVAALISTIGLVTIAILGDWARRRSAYFSAFAIGTLSVAVIFHLLPEAISYSASAWQMVFVGFAGLSVFGLALIMATGRRSRSSSLAVGYASIIALGFHSFLDGVVYETTFHSHAFTGWLSACGLLLHEFPEGVIAYFLVRDAGLGNVPSAIWAFLAASVTTVAGAALTTYAFSSATDLPIGELLGLTAGALLYVMVFHLGPHASKTPNKRGYDFASFGAIVALAAVVLRHFSH